MALTLRRWLILAGLGCLAIAVAYLPPPQREWRIGPMEEPTPEQARVQRLTRAYNRADHLLTGERFLDSLRRELGRRPIDGGLQVVVRGPLPAESQRLFREAVVNMWQRVERQPGATLVVILNTDERWYQSRYVVPSALDGRTCAASFGVDWSVKWLRQGQAARDAAQRPSQLEPWIRNEVAPCLYFAVFGNPGPAINRWLVARAFKPAYDADWQATPPSFRFQDEPAAYDLSRWDVSFDALACATGGEERCQEALLLPVERDFRVSLVPGVVMQQFWSNSFLTEQHYLANLVHEMGTERFGRFWRSNTPLDTAFQQAFGQSMRVWTAGWARHVTPDLPPFGPRPRIAAVLFGLALAALAVGAAAAGVMRRQVG